MYILQVEHILIVEELLIKYRILQRWRQYFGTEHSLTFTLVNEQSHSTSLSENIAFFIWGGERYDTYQTLKDFIKN